MQEDHEFKVNLSYRMKLYFKTPNAMKAAVIVCMTGTLVVFIGAESGSIGPFAWILIFSLLSPLSSFLSHFLLPSLLSPSLRFPPSLLPSLSLISH